MALPTAVNNALHRNDHAQDIDHREIHRKAKAILGERPAFANMLMRQRVPKMTRTLMRVFERGLKFSGEKVPVADEEAGDHINEGGVEETISREDESTHEETGPVTGIANSPTNGILNQDMTGDMNGEATVEMTEVTGQETTEDVTLETEGRTCGTATSGETHREINEDPTEGTIPEMNTGETMEKMPVQIETDHEMNGDTNNKGIFANRNGESTGHMDVDVEVDEEVEMEMDIHGEIKGETSSKRRMTNGETHGLISSRNPIPSSRLHTAHYPFPPHQATTAVMDNSMDRTNGNGSDTDTDMHQGGLIRQNMTTTTIITTPTSTTTTAVENDDDDDDDVADNDVITSSSSGFINRHSTSHPEHEHEPEQDQNQDQD